MGIRQTLNDNPVVTTSVTGVIIVAAVFFLFRSACSGPGGGADAVPTKAYFTVDDGATYFPDDATKIPPFTHEGKTAYRVRVYKCPDGTTYVSHLERYSDAEKKKIEAATAAARESGKGPLAAEPLAMLASVEVKKPGDKEWLSMSAAGVEKYMAVMRPRCPDSSTNVVPVLPSE